MSRKDHERFRKFEFKRLIYRNSILSLFLAEQLKWQSSYIELKGVIFLKESLTSIILGALLVVLRNIYKELYGCVYE